MDWTALGHSLEAGSDCQGVERGRHLPLRQQRYPRLWLLHTVLSPSYTGVEILHLGSPWRLFWGVPTASHPHLWLVPYLDGTDTRDFCLLVVFSYVL